MKTRNAVTVWVLILLMAVVFFLIFCTNVSADSGTPQEIKGYESVLIREGDTLLSIASRYADVKSSFSVHDYMDAIISLNDLDSEFIRSGNYLLLPDYK